MASESYRLSVEKRAVALTAGWRNGPPVKVVRDVQDLPVAAPDDAMGIYRKGEVFLVAGAMDHEHVPGILAHEAVAHHGLRAILRGEWADFMRGVHGAIDGGDAALRAAQAAVRRAYVDEAGQFDLPRVHEADEIAANLTERIVAQDGRVQVPNPWRAMRRAFVGHFLRKALLLERPVDASELHGALLWAERHLRRLPPGTRRARFVRLLQRCYILPMTKWDVNKPPMSMGESETLYRRGAEQDRSRFRWREAAVIWPLTIGVIAVVVLFLWVAFGTFSFFTNPWTAAVLAVVALVWWLRSG